uniref:Uncharacterized protein n=1 Tax=Picea sitchensis TaxID=3332 RepID=A9NQI0_PICSI|nr:unknown [Picea sitchensis]
MRSRCPRPLFRRIHLRLRLRPPTTPRRLRLPRSRVVGNSLTIIIPITTTNTDPQWTNRSPPTRTRTSKTASATTRPPPTPTPTVTLTTSIRSRNWKSLLSWWTTRSPRRRATTCSCPWPRTELEVEAVGSICCRCYRISMISSSWLPRAALRSPRCSKRTGCTITPISPIIKVQLIIQNR